MKELAKIEKELGGDGGKVVGAIGVEGQNLIARAEVQYPIAAVIDPVMKVVDELVDKLEALIPGDQTAIAAAAKADAREAIAKALAEKLAA